MDAFPVPQLQGFFLSSLTLIYSRLRFTEKEKKEKVSGFYQNFKDNGQGWWGGSPTDVYVLHSYLLFLLESSIRSSR